MQFSVAMGDRDMNQSISGQIWTKLNSFIFLSFKIDHVRSIICLHVTNCYIYWIPDCVFKNKNGETCS